MSLHQNLYGNDFLKRVSFCNWIRRKMRTDVSYLNHVLSSDEANYTNTGNVNRHNMHYLANENPRWMRTVPFQHPWSVNCCCRIVGDHIIGPYYALCSRQVMNKIFDEKWIGRGGPVAMPPCSPDLTSLDYFLWGFVKEHVMVVAPTMPNDMKERIRRACTEITPQMLA